MIKSIEPYSSIKRHLKGRGLLKAYKAHNPGNVELLTNITPHSPQPQAFRRSMGLLGNAPGASLEAFADIKAV